MMLSDLWPLITYAFGICVGMSIMYYETLPMIATVIP